MSYHTGDEKNDKSFETRKKSGQRKNYSTLPPERQFVKAKNYIMWAVSRSARTENEIKMNLSRKQCSQEVIEAVIEWAQEYNFINDKEYTEMFIQQYLGTQGKPMKWVEMKLKTKGITSETIETVTNEMWDSEMFTEETQTRNATIFAETTMRRLSNEKDPMKLKKKFTDRMLRAGYSYPTIQHTWNIIAENSH